jgi:hypothetical protein
MTKRFFVEEFGSAAFKKRLEQCALHYRGNLEPFSAILTAIANSPHACKSVLFEYDYVDKDYQDEYAAFYCKAFKQYKSRCVRLHFFSRAIPRRTKWNFGRYAEHYFGYVVIRPTDLQRVGRTVLRPTVTDPDRQFVHCSVECHAHILGETFTVAGMPFIQQDTQVGACAQASLWMLARYMSRRFGYREFLPSEINQLAKANMAVGRLLPAQDGLNPYQMLDALSGMGIPALFYSRDAFAQCSKHIMQAFPVDPTASADLRAAQQVLQNTLQLADIAYRYIESGLPVILGTSSHALVAIGHTYDPSIQARISIERIPSFYVNNDNKGPYREMPIFATSLSDYSFGQVDRIIPVLPPEVTLRGEEAETMARESIDELLNRVLPGPPPLNYRDFITQHINTALAGKLEKMEFRTFLQSSVEFQASMRQSMSCGNFDREVGRVLLQLAYPKYIWITEASSSVLLNHPDKKDRKCVGRVIVDSTAPAKTRGALALHIADFLQVIDRTTGKIETAIHPHSTPFGHKVLTQP